MMDWRAPLALLLKREYGPPPDVVETQGRHLFSPPSTPVSPSCFDAQFYETLYQALRSLEFHILLRGRRYGVDAEESRAGHTPPSVHLRFWQEQARIRQEELNDPGTPSDSDGGFAEDLEEDYPQRREENSKYDDLACQKDNNARTEDELSDKPPALSHTSPASRESSPHPRTPDLDTDPDLRGAYAKTGQPVSINQQQQQTVSGVSFKLPPVCGIKRKCSFSGQERSPCRRTPPDRDGEQGFKRIRAL